MATMAGVSAAATMADGGEFPAGPLSDSVEVEFTEC